MANSLCSTPICSFETSNRPGTISTNSLGRKAFQTNEVFQNSKVRNFQSLKVKAEVLREYLTAHFIKRHEWIIDQLNATENDQSTKPKSIVCPKCDANGAILCTQCNGTGVNSVDHFNGQFKAGGLCWLCRGKKDILCGNCNGAGFLGGFMSSFDD